MFQQSQIPFSQKTAQAALLLKAHITGMNTIAFPHNNTLKQKIPNTPLVIGKIPDDIEYLVHTHGTALAGLI